MNVLSVLACCLQESFHYLEEPALFESWTGGLESLMAEQQRTHLKGLSKLCMGLHDIIILARLHSTFGAPPASSERPCQGFDLCEVRALLSRCCPDKDVRKELQWLEDQLQERDENIKKEREAEEGETRLFPASITPGMTCVFVVVTTCVVNGGTFRCE